MQRIGPLIIIVIVFLLVFWPTIYALVKRRWIRAFAYFVLTLPVIWITTNAADWWGPIDPEDDYGPHKNRLLYDLITWPVLTAVLWTITAFSDLLLAPEKPRSTDEV